MKIQLVANPSSNIKIIQSYIFTESKFSYNVYEMRVLYNIVRVLQAEFKGQKIMEFEYKVENAVYGEHTRIMMPITAFVGSEELEPNYEKIKSALRKLESKSFEVNMPGLWEIIRVVFLLKIEKGYVSFVIHKQIASAILDFSKGYRKYDFQKVMNLSSVYAMRFYTLFSVKSSTQLTYTIVALKEIFGLENKYPNNSDFIKKVVIAAKKELDDKSPYTFTYKKEGRGQFATLTFTPIYQPQFEDKELEAKELESNYPSRYFLSSEFINYLKEFNFTDKEIKTHNFLLCECEKKIVDVIQYIADRKKYIELATNQKGYIVKMLQKEIKGENIYEESKVYSTKKTGRKATSSIPTAEELAKKFAQEHKVK